MMRHKCVRLWGKREGDLCALPQRWSPAVAAPSSVGNGVQVAARLLLLGRELAHVAVQFVCLNPMLGRAPAKTCLFVVVELIKTQS